MTRLADLNVVVQVYAITVAVSMRAGKWYLDHAESPLFSFSTIAMDTALIADLVGTVIIFISSVLLNNSSMYDAFWSAIPIFLGCYWLGDRGFEALVAEPGYERRLLVFAVLFVWGNRLTYNWARSWEGFKHEDWRYVEVFQKRTKPAVRYWVESFLGIHVFPTVIVFAAMVPCYWILHDPEGSQAKALSVWDYAGAILGFAASTIQWIADNQLRDFRKDSGSAGRVLDSGLWSWSRHPNYFGEICHWFSYILFSIGAFGKDAALHRSGGAVAIGCLFVFASVPMMEERMRASRQAKWAAYTKRTYSSLIPLPPRT
jgi:steroid 5-alpha reductase family enzyme